MKDKVFDPAQDLIDRIRKAIEHIGQSLCDLIMEHFLKSICNCRRGLGGHLADVVLHYRRLFVISK